MILVEVDGIRLRFGDSWTSAEKWDDSRAFSDGIGKLQGTLDSRPEGTKAVDVVADNGRLVLIEVKGFRTRRTSTRGTSPVVLAAPRRAELPFEIGLKVRDSLAGVWGAAWQEADPPRVARLIELCRKPARVVACILQDHSRPNESRQKRQVRDGELRKNIERRVAWCTRDVFVLDLLRDSHRRDRALPDVVPESLPM